MLLGTKKTLSDHIIEALLEKEGSVASIQEYLKGKKVPATVQGIYKTLRQLIVEDVAVKQKKIYAVSNVWRGKMSDLVSGRVKFKLSKGEQTVYRFNKMEHLDAFWKHILADINEEIGLFPVFHFVPHQFWIYVEGRQESEIEYYSNFEKKQTRVYTIIGDTTEHDKRVRESQSLHQIHLDSETSFNRRDHISAIGPYVVITRISKTLAEKTDDLYEKITEESLLKENLADLFKNPGSIVMIVEHNESKAKKLRKMMAKNFYIPSELREKFNLF